MCAQSLLAAAVFACWHAQLSSWRLPCDPSQCRPNSASYREEVGQEAPRLHSWVHAGQGSPHLDDTRCKGAYRGAFGCWDVRPRWKLASMPCAGLSACLVYAPQAYCKPTTYAPASGRTCNSLQELSRTMWNGNSENLRTLGAVEGGTRAAL